jgi:hypothetical protein
MQIEVLKNLRHLAHAPGVQFQEVVPDSMLPDYELLHPLLRLRWCWQHVEKMRIEALETCATWHLCSMLPDLFFLFHVLCSTLRR